MTSSLQITDITSRLPSTDHAAAYEIRHPGSGLHAFIALHDTSHGPAVGGVRRTRYSSLDAARDDALSLSAQMTRKVAFARLPCGGGKSVIIDHPDLDLDAAYEAFGRAVHALDGRYFCGPDVGTGPDALDRIRQATRYVNAPENDASVSTARGVLAGIRATLAHCGPSGPLSAVVQGVGNVGRLVVEGLAARTAGDGVLYASDVNAKALAALDPDVRRLPAERATGTPAHLFAPCALGPVVTHASSLTLPFGAICGSANTQLESDALAQTLADRGVLYAPDFVVNAGAVIEGVLVLFDSSDDVRERVNTAIDGIEARLAAVFREAEQAARTPLEIALAHCIRSR